MHILMLILAIIIYLVILLMIGIYTKKWVRDPADYMLASREFGIAANVLELCAIALAGSLMTFLPSLVIQYGLRTALIRYVVVLGCGYIIYGLLFGKLARDSGAQTVAEYLELRFDYKVRMVVAVTSSFAMLGISANNVLAITNVINRLTGIPQMFIASVCFVIIILFSVMGGFWGITITDMIQLLIGVAALFGLIFFLMHQYGGWPFLMQHFPSSNLWTTGTNGESMRFFAVRYPSGITMLLNFMVFLLWGNNYYFLRLNTCRNGHTARLSYVIAGAVGIPVLLAPVCLLGAYAAAIYPEHFWGRHMVDGSSALSLLIGHVPASLKILMIVGFFAVTVSTASTALIGVTSTVSRDIWRRRYRPDLSASEELKVQKRLMFFVALIGWLICFYQGGTIRLFGLVTSWLGPVAVLMLMAALCPWFTNSGALCGDIAGVIILISSSAVQMMGIHSFFSRIHSSILGIVTTLCVGTVGSLFTRSNYYGKLGWRCDPGKGIRQKIRLSFFDTTVLGMIRYGTVTMADITDYFGCDSRMTKASVEALDKGGYIKRDRDVFSGFFRLQITEKGKDVLGELTGSASRLEKVGLSVEQFLLLRCVADPQMDIEQYKEARGYGSLKLTALVSILELRGYIRQHGFIKRKISITENGKSIVRAFGDVSE